MQLKHDIKDNFSSGGIEASLTVRQNQVEDIFGNKETHYTIIHCPVKRRKHIVYYNAQ